MRVAIEEREGAEENFPVDGLVVGVGLGKVCSRYQRGAEGEKEKKAGEDERFCGRTWTLGESVRRIEGGAPVWRRWIEG